MKKTTKTTVLAAAAMLFASHLFASYWVVLKDGTRYQAKAKPTIQNGRAIIQLDAGGSLAVDPNAIDAAKSDEVTRLGGGEVIGIQQPQSTAPAAAPKQSTLGSQIHLRQPAPTKQATAPVAPSKSPVAPVAVAPTSGSAISTEIADKFTRAYENVGIYEHTITGIGPGALRAELTADSEEKVFNILSATAFLINKNAGVSGADIQLVELFIKTTNGGSGGRFKMTRADAQALDAKQMTRDALADYFVRNVLY
jgi:hypothetical protein